MEMDQYNRDIDGDEEKKPSVIKKVFKLVAVAIMLAVYLILFIRIFVSCDSDIVDMIIKTDRIVSEYEKDPENFEIQQYEITNWYKSINDGKLLSVDNLYYFPSADSLQISVKFNKDILTHDAEYSNELLPFEFYLEDEQGNIYTEYTAVYDERYDFGYIRLCFENIEFEIQDGEADEYGNLPRKSYEMYIRMLDDDGNYSEFESFSIYTGKINYKKIYYK